MNEKIELILNLLSTEDKLTWVKSQVESSLAEGITERVSDQRRGNKAGTETPAKRDPQSSEARKEQTKRESYETTRPYTLEEQMNLLEFALEQVFVELPTIQRSAVAELKRLAPETQAIEFLSDSEQSAVTTQPVGSEANPLSDSALTRDEIKTFMQEVRKA